MKKFVLIIGGQAVGKMTVGEELEKITGLKLFHNHMAIELVHQLYGYGTELPENKRARHKELFSELRENIREVVFRNIAKSFFPGVIATFVMCFDQKYDWELLEHYKNVFANSAKQSGEETEFYCVELVCDTGVRQIRNQTLHRLEQKLSKRNVEFSFNDMKNTMLNHRIVSNGDEGIRFGVKHYLKIDNTNLPASETAKLINQSFKLKCVDKQTQR